MIQNILMNATILGWLTVQELGPTRTVVLLPADFSAKAIESIRRGVPARELLAAQLGPASFHKRLEVPTAHQPSSGVNSPRLLPYGARFGLVRGTTATSAAVKI